MFAQCRAPHIRRHRALPDQRRAGAMNSQGRPLFNTLHRRKPHRRPTHCLADRLRVSAIAVVALHVRLDIGRQHQPHLVTMTTDHPYPMMGAAAGLHIHQARGQLAKNTSHRCPSKLASRDHRSRRINAVKLKHVVRQILSNRANLVDGRSPLSGRNRHRRSGTRMPFRGRPSHHIFDPFAGCLLGP